MANRFTVSSKGVSIGRDSRNDVVVSNEYVSRFHAFLILNKSGLTIVDRDSTNGIEFSISWSEWIKVDGIVTIPFIDGEMRIRLSETEEFDLVPKV